MSLIVRCIWYVLLYREYLPVHVQQNLPGLGWRRSNDAGSQRV